MLTHPHRTKIVATIGPASNSPEMIRKMIQEGMAVARLNFSHGSYEDHAKTVQTLQQVAKEMGYPLTLLQDLQGPKIRVGHLPQGRMTLTEKDTITLVFTENYQGENNIIPIDYAEIAQEVEIGILILLDDGKFILEVTALEEKKVICQVKRGGILGSRKGVNFPTLNLRLPSMTEKDKQDLKFGISQNIDWVALSFVRQGSDIDELKALLQEYGKPDLPILAKIEKPQAVAHLDDIVKRCDGIMVARGDLGVELNPEKVPMLQKHIIHACNKHGIPAITATQMLETMIDNPQPTRAEASDVANAIIDGTDAVMLSGESAVGQYPLLSVQMLARIATEVEPGIEFINFPPETNNETHALSEALNTIDKILDLRWIVAFTTSGYTVSLAAAERPNAPIVAFTTDRAVYFRLNLIWGVTPILITEVVESIDFLIEYIETRLYTEKLVETGDKILILGSIPVQMSKGTNFLKIHTIGNSPQTR